jgi:hypothetical protein
VGTIQEGRYHRVVILRPGYGVTTEHKIELPYNKGKGKAL